MTWAAQRELALEAVRAAAEVIRRQAAGDQALRGEEKAAGDYVTEVDRLAEAAVLRVLRAGSPAPILAEESGGARAPDGWVVDPVDGTTNLLRRFPVVGVSVALLAGGRPVAGAIGAPLLGEEWSAAEGGGAHDRRGAALTVSGRPGAGVVATGFPFRHKERLARYRAAFDPALRDFEDLRRAGAASLDLAYVAQGTFDGFFELGLQIWDIAAGVLLVRESGGVVTDWRGDPDAVLQTGDILAGSPGWHRRMLALLS